MAKTTIAQLEAAFAAQAARIDALEDEVRRLHRSAAHDAAAPRRAKSEKPAAPSRKFKTMAEAARAYCKAHDTRSCTPAQIRDWLAH